MHVVFITPGFARNENDETTIPPLLLYAKELSRQGVKVSVIAIDYPIEQRDYLIGNVRVYAMGGANKGWPLKLITLIKAGIFFSELHKQRTVDVIHSFWWQDTAMLGAALSRRYRLPHVTTCMGQDVLGNNNYARWFSPKNMQVVALSQYHAQHFESTFKRKPTAIIPWGIEPAEFVNDDWQVKDIDILGVGSLIPIKNYDDFIETVALVKQRHPDIKCKIVGEGEMLNDLQQKVHALGLSTNVKFMGLLQRSQVLKLMERSKVLLHTSKYESFGYVFAEAMAGSTQVVCYEVGFANNTNAFIGSNTHELAAHINQVLKEDSAPVMPVVYTIQQTVEMYLELYAKT